MNLDLQSHLRRVSSCHRHPEEPRNGICASCLRDRLSTFPSADPLRRSSDFRSRRSLSYLFNLEDQTINLGFLHGEGEEIRVCDDGEVKPMKQHIDLELETTEKHLKGNILEAASHLIHRFRKWKTGKLSTSRDFSTRSEIGDYGFGRRSCDTHPRISLDAARISLDEFDEIKALDDVKSLSNDTGVSPHKHEGRCGTKSSSNTQRDDCTNGKGDKEMKIYHGWRKAWSFLGLLRRRNNGMCYRGPGVSDPNVEPLENLGVCSGRLLRSKSCVVGSLHSKNGDGSLRGLGKTNREHVLETRHSPGNHEIGLLRFYLTPLRTYRRSKPRKSRLNGSRSTDRGVLGL